jgi:hypothetical protein
VRLQHSSRLLIGSGPAQQVRQLGNVTDEAQGILMSASLGSAASKSGAFLCSLKATRTAENGARSHSHDSRTRWVRLLGLDKRTPLISGVQLTDATIAGDKPRSSIMLDGV